MLARIRRSAAREDHGFTLIELIVVVVILGVLAAVAVPVYLGQVQKAKVSADVATLTTAKTAIAAYMAETGGAATTMPSEEVLASYGWQVQGGPRVTDYNETTGRFTLVLSPTAEKGWENKSQSGKKCTVTATTKPVCV